MFRFLNDSKSNTTLPAVEPVPVSEPAVTESSYTNTVPKTTPPPPPPTTTTTTADIPKESTTESPVVETEVAVEVENVPVSEPENEAVVEQETENEHEQENLEPEANNEPKKTFSYAMMAAKAPLKKAVPAVSPTASPEKKKAEKTADVPSMNGKTSNQAKPPKPEIFSIYVTTKEIEGSVSKDTLKDGLHALLSQYGAIGRITIGKNGGFAFVDFGTKEAQDAALASGSVTFNGVTLPIQEKKSSEGSGNNGGRGYKPKGRDNRNGGRNSGGDNKRKENRDRKQGGDRPINKENKGRREKQRQKEN